MDVFGEDSTILPCNHSFTKEQKKILLLTRSGTAFVSFTMCLIVVSIVFCLRLYKYFTYRLALYQIMSSMFLSLGQVSAIAILNYDGNTRQKIACKTTSFLLVYFEWTKLLFTICLVFHLFSLAVCLKNFKKLEIGYVLFSILFPLLYTWIPFIHNSYGVAGAWCWIRDWKDDCATQKYLEGIIEHFALWYGPLFISLTLSVVAVFIILIVLARRAFAHDNSEREYLVENQERYQIKKAIKELLPLLAYPVIFFILSMFPIINRVYSAISAKVSFQLALAHAFTESLWGFFSSWALIIHIFVVRQLKKKKCVNNKELPSHTTAVAATGTIIYTTYTEISTNARTKYIIPAESDIDSSD